MERKPSTGGVQDLGERFCTRRDDQFCVTAAARLSKREGFATGDEQHLVRIGNAAQTLHPVAGQGLNLGLRDAWELATEMKRWRREDVGAAGLLRNYAAKRRLDRGGGIWFTHNLVRLFSGDVAPARLARGLGLAALGAIPPAKDFVVRRMTFGARG